MEAGGNAGPPAGAQPSHPVWDDEETGDPWPPELRRLIEKAHDAFQEDRVEEGEALLRQTLAYGEIPTVINNLALLQLEHYNRPEEALKLLQRNLERPKQLWQPFTRAVAALSYVRLNDPIRARQLVRQAIKDYELGLAALHDASEERQRSWREYTSKILQAVGALGEDQWALDLYRRWSRHHVLGSSHFYGGVAAFNLKRFRAARRAWSRVRGAVPGLMRSCETVAEWCEKRYLEPFPMAYEYVGPDMWDFYLLAKHVMHASDVLDLVAADVHLARYIEKPANRMFMTWVTFCPFLPSQDPVEKDPGAAAQVTHFIAAAGDWGEACARRLLEAPKVDKDAKVAVVRGLVLTGRLLPGDTVHMQWEGKLQDVPVDRVLS